MKSFVPVLLCALLSLAQSGLAGDWPEFLGPNRNGVSTETNLVERWGTNGPPLLWEKTIGTGYSAPSVRAGQLVLHHRQGSEEVVESWDARTGRELWRYSYGSSYTDPYGYNNGPRSTPLLSSNRCYTFGAQGKLVCLELASGKKVWEVDTARQWEVPEAFFGVGSTPVLEGNTLLVMVGGQPNAGMVALDAATGKTLWENVGETNWQGQPMHAWPGERSVQWRRYEKQASYATPVAATVHGTRVVFCLMRQGLVMLNPTNGQVHASYWFRSRADDSVNAANPVVVGNQVFISGAYYKIGSVLLEVLPGLKGFEVIWRSTALELHWNTPIYHNGNLYAFSGRNEPDARMRCVEFKSGRVLWERDESWRHTTQTPGTYGRGSFLMADNRLFALGEGGLLGLLRLNAQHPEEICRAQLSGLHYPCWAAPVLADKRLYLRSENRLICLDVSRQ